MMKVIQKIICHHLGGTDLDPYYDSSKMSVLELDEIHRYRFNMKSSLNHWAGYTFFISYEGMITQLRAISEETAATTGSNFDSIHIVLAGNFTLRPTGEPVQMPTQRQIAALRALWRVLRAGREEIIRAGYAIQDMVAVSPTLSTVKPHRAYATVSPTQCYGTALTDRWIVDTLTAGEYLSIIDQLKLIVLKLQAFVADKKRTLVVGAEVSSTACYEFDERG